MWMIKHVKSNKWLRAGSRYWQKGSPLNESYMLTARGGRIFKRKSDLSSHIAQNLDFYNQFRNDFEVVEFETREKSTSSMDIMLEANDERKKQKEQDLKQFQERMERERLARLEQEVLELKKKLG